MRVLLAGTPFWVFVGLESSPPCRWHSGASTRIRCTRDPLPRCPALTHGQSSCDRRLLVVPFSACSELYYWLASSCAHFGLGNGSSGNWSLIRQLEKGLRKLVTTGGWQAASRQDLEPPAQLFPYFRHMPQPVSQVRSKSEALNSFSPLASPAGTPCRKRSLGTGMLCSVRPLQSTTDLQSMVTVGGGGGPWGGVGGDLVGGGTYLIPRTTTLKGGWGGGPPPPPTPTLILGFRTC